MNTATRSNILVRVARRIAAIGSEISYAQHRADEKLMYQTRK
ncbi:MAG TPA: hypothetical protein VHO07_12690 [Streptosporangiaceae bacterium]|jgi:hypothetical protein|nr:hypothetical protein [Streptosporangiaceae bacterium]HEX2821008.1 hypothetical protein [Streptosporangiaceae bacterium]